MRRFLSRGRCGWRVASDWSPWKHRIAERHVSPVDIRGAQSSRRSRWEERERFRKQRDRRTSPETDVIHTRALHSTRTRRRRMRACGSLTFPALLQCGGEESDESRDLGRWRLGFCACCIWIQTSDCALSLSGCASRVSALIEAATMTTAGQEQHQHQDRTMTTVSKKSIIAKMFKVRKRREMLLAQVCLVCSVLFVAWGMSNILTRTGESASGCQSKPSDVPDTERSLSRWAGSLQEEEEEGIWLCSCHRR